MVKIFFFVLFLVPCTSAFAVEVEHDEAYYEKHPCGAGSAILEAQCSSEKLAVSDKKLTSVYNQLLKKLPKRSVGAANKSQLISAQRAWLKYRDLDCSFHGASTGANYTWQAVHGINCQIEFNEERIKTLKELDPL